MSAVRTVAKQAGHVAARTASAVTHPIQSAAFVVGLARGAVHIARGGRELPDAEGRSGAPGEWVPPRPGEKLTDASGVPAASSAPAEPTATEPKASSRNAEHGGPGADRFDDWREEIDDGPDVETAVGTTGAGAGENPSTGKTDLQPQDDEPLIDPALTKSVKSEAETMGKAADPKKGDGAS